MAQSSAHALAFAQKAREAAQRYEGAVRQRQAEVVHLGDAGRGGGLSQHGLGLLRCQQQQYTSHAAFTQASEPHGSCTSLHVAPCGSEQAWW